MLCQNQSLEGGISLVMFNDALRKALSKALNMPVKEEKIDSKKEIERLVETYEKQQVEELKTV